MNIGLIQTRAANFVSRNVEQLEVCWQTPEAWKWSIRYGEDSEMYGFGYLLWSLMTGRLCEGKTEEKVKTCEPSEAYKNLMLACRAASPRPKLGEIAQRLKNLTERPPSPTGEACYENRNTTYEAGNLAKAWTWYLCACEEKSPLAYTGTGLFRFEGLGWLPIDKKEVIADVERAYKGKTDQGVPDDGKALYWYARAAKAAPTDIRVREEVDLLTKSLNPTQTYCQYRSNAFRR